MSVSQGSCTSPSKLFLFQILESIHSRTPVQNLKTVPVFCKNYIAITGTFGWYSQFFLYTRDPLGHFWKLVTMSVGFIGAGQLAFSLARGFTAAGRQVREIGTDLQ